MKSELRRLPSVDRLISEERVRQLREVYPHNLVVDLLRHPLCGLMWLLGFAMSRVEFMLGVDFDKYERGFFWTKSSPLKNIDRK